MTNGRLAHGSMLSVAWLAGFVVCLLAFAAVAEVARQPEIPPLDVSTSERLHDLASPALDVLMRAVTGLGSTLVLIVVSGAAAAALLSRGQRALALLVVAALIASLVLNEGLKLFFERPRPGFDWAEVRPEHGFPSGHAMNSLVVYSALALIVGRVLGRRVGALALVLALVLALAVGGTRIYLGVHWLTDVVGGFLAGGLLLLVLLAVFEAAHGLQGSGAQPGRGPRPDPSEMGDG